MAKVGEGDPRWIVNERKDGANVNAWHWEERDLSKHTHEEFKRHLKDFSLCAGGHGLRHVKLDEVSEISGDVTVAQRKGKMMCYFELKLTLKWSGVTEDSEKEIKGKMEIPDVDHDQFTEEYDMIVTCQETGAEAQKVEDWVRAEGRAVVRREIEKYFNALFAEYHIGQMLKSGAGLPPPPPATEKTPPATTAKPVESGAETSFSWKMRWGAPREELFASLTQAPRASVYTRAPATIDPRAGGQFQFLGGLISGYFVEVQGEERIKEQWRLSSWPAGVHSSVVMQLIKEEPGVTVLEFAQCGIPAGQLACVQEGWRAHFFEAMKMSLGYSLHFI